MAEALQEEVTRLAGHRYSRKEDQNPNRRWGSQQSFGSKSALFVPRVRNVATDEEISLQTYHHLKVPDVWT